MPKVLSFTAPIWEQVSTLGVGRGERQSEIDVVTCEYPPMVGGIADYTRSLAERLDQRGCTTRVWAPGSYTEDESFPENRSSSKPSVMRTFGRFGISDILTNERLLGSSQERFLLLQWEPVGFGRCVVSNKGPETEALWSKCAGLRLV